MRDPAPDLVAAFSPFDAEALTAVLAPDLRYEGVSSNGIEEFKEASAVVDAYRSWFGWYDSVELIGSEVRRTAGLPWVTVRHRLAKGDESWLMEMNFCVYEQDNGTITRLGLLCTGPQPEV